MTVQELIEYLLLCNGDATVKIGDHAEDIALDIEIEYATSNAFNVVLMPEECAARCSICGKLASGHLIKAYLFVKNIGTITRMCRDCA